MNTQDIRQRLSSAIEKATTSEALEKAIGDWKTFLETEKLNAEIEKAKTEIDNIQYQKQSDKTKFWIGVVAPMVTAIVLISTLIFQIFQTKQNAEIQRQTEQDRQWNNLLQKLNTKTVPTDMSIGIQLKTFLASPQYKQQAFQVGTSILFPHMVDHKLFKSIFKDFENSLDITNYGYLVNLTDGIYQQISDGRHALKNDSDAIRNYKDGSFQYEETAKRIDEELHGIKESHTELEMTGDAIAKFIKSTNALQDGKVDLSDGFLFYTDFSNTNLSSANLSNTILEDCNLDGSNLGGVTQIDSSSWPETAWWRAKSISDSLLSYLAKNYPYDSTISYSPEAKDDRKHYENWVNKVK